jgi:hypothetical protein
MNQITITNDRLDPSTLGEFPCHLCGHVSLAWFLWLEHRREGCNYLATLPTTHIMFATVVSQESV